MKIKRKKLAQYLKMLGISESEFIESMHLDTNRELDILCGCNTLNEDESRKFINMIGADHAMKLIDWEGMNVRMPSRRAILGYAN